MNYKLIFLLFLLSCVNPPVEPIAFKVLTPEMASNKLQASNLQMEAQARQFSTVIMNVDSEERVLYLTFDDGPSKYTPVLLDSLKALNVKATFFVLGEAVKKYPKAFNRMVLEGHAIGNHTYDHKHFKNLSDNQILEEFKRTDAELKKLKIETNLVRIPWGNLNNDQVELLYNKKIVHWSVNTDDWYFNKQQAGVDSIYARIVDHATPGAIVLAHDGGGNREKTINGISRAIRILQAKGWKFKNLN